MEMCVRLWLEVKHPLECTEGKKTLILFDQTHVCYHSTLTLDLSETLVTESPSL